MRGIEREITRSERETEREKGRMEKRDKDIKIESDTEKGR